jgi:Secretion system C-terminal sorting domain
MKRLLTLTFILVSNWGFGQTWSKLYDNQTQPLNGARAYGCKLWDDTIYVSQILIDSTNHLKSGISKIDLNGNQTNFRKYDLENETANYWNWSYSGYNQLSNNLDSLIYLPFNHGISEVSVYENGWVGINQELEMTEMHDQTGIDGSDKLEFNGVYKSDTAIFVYGSRAEPGQFFNQDNEPNSIVIKTDLDGNVIWKSAFEDSYSVNALFELSDGDIILNTAWVAPSYQNTKRLIKADSNGDEQWRITFGGMYTGNLSTMIETSSGKILTANSWNVYYSDEPGTGWWYRKWIQLQLIEDLGESYEIEQDVKWAPTSDVEEVYGIEEMPSGNFLTWGIMQNTSGGVYDTLADIWDRPYTRGYLFMLNPELDSLWLRTYYYPDEDDILECYSTFSITDVVPLESGGFVTCGWGEIHGEDDLEKVWLMRLDEYGCLEPGCQNVNVTEIVLGFENSMTIFPNPVHDICTIQWNLENLSALQSNFRNTELIVTDSQGREVKRLPISNFGNHHKIQIDVTDFSAGIYQAHWVRGSSWLDTSQFIKE